MDKSILTEISASKEELFLLGAAMEMAPAEAEEWGAFEESAVGLSDVLKTFNSLPD